MPSFFRQIIQRLTNSGKSQNSNIKPNQDQIIETIHADIHGKAKTPSFEVISGSMPMITENIVQPDPVDILPVTQENIPVVSVTTDPLTVENQTPQDASSIVDTTACKTEIDPCELACIGQEQPPLTDEVVGEETLLEENEQEDDAAEQQDDVNDITRAVLVVRDLYGASISYNLTSSKWAQRKDGLLELQGKIEVEKPHATEFIAALCTVLARLMRDKVSPVTLAALDCFKTFLKTSEESFDSAITPSLTLCLHALIHCMGSESSCKRVQRDACKCIMKISSLSSIDGLIIIVPLLQDSSINVKPRLSLARILIQEFGSGLKCKGLVTGALNSLCLEGLQSSDDKIRKLGRNLFAVAFPCYGKGLKRIFGELNPATAKILEDKMAEMEQEANNSESLPMLLPAMSQTAAVGVCSSPMKPVKQLKSLTSLSKSASLPMLKLNKPLGDLESRSNLIAGFYGQDAENEDNI